MKRERLGTAERLGWSVVGFGLGLAGGLWVAGHLGRRTRSRLAGELRVPHAPAGGSGVALAETVRSALAADPALAPLALGTVAVVRGTVELTGWVPDRRTRAYAVRLASRVPGLTDIINSILVHGEDDTVAPPTLTLKGRSA